MPSNTTTADTETPANQGDAKVLAPLVLPWPNRKLNPNYRKHKHWGPQSAAKKTARRQAAHLARAAGWDKAHWPEGKLAVWIDYYAPDKRRRDVDNLLASSKAALDGIADAIGVNDRDFVPHPYLRDEVVERGMVRIVITRMPPRPEYCV